MKLFWIFALFVLFSSLHADTLTGLALRYDFSGNAYDTSGYNRNGSVNGATLTTDRFGNANSAYRFDGNDYINTNTDFSWGYNNSFTISVWFKTDNFLADQVLVSKPNYEYSLKIGGLSNYDDYQVFEYWTPGGGGSIGLNYNVNALLNNTWYNTTITYNGSSHLASMYINGQLIASHTVTAAPRDLAETTLLGYGYHWQGQSRYFQGSMDDVRFYDRGLTSSDVLELYGAVPECSSLCLLLLGGFCFWSRAKAKRFFAMTRRVL